MADTVKKIIKTLGIIIVSIGIGFVLTFIIWEINIVRFPSEFVPFIWLFFTIISAIPLRRLIKSDGKSGQSGAWGSPEQSRDQIVNAPQFVGRFDRARGLLDSTARMVEYDRTYYQGFWMYKAKELTIARFRGELLDQNGTPLEYILVEIKGETNKWTGSLADGDRMRVSGKMKNDGILHAKNAFNYSTNSWFGEV
jgi:hypothetical protein